MKEISVIIPVLNEADNIAELHREIKKVCQDNRYQYEIILVDDGSTDKTPEIARKLLPIKYVRFRKRSGQTAAFDAGIKLAKYPYIITMDGDLQNDPRDIPRLISYLEANSLDVVSGWRKNRRDSFSKKIASRLADLLRRILINDGIHDSGCSLKIYKKECFDKLSLYGEMHRFIPGILKTKGFQIGEIAVNHRPRTAGQTKYNWHRFVKGIIDLVAIWFWGKYAVRPLHLLGGLGILITGLGILSSVATFIQFLGGQDLSDTALTTLSVFLLIMGVQLFILGMLADMVAKNYHDSLRLTPYSIKEIVENND